MVARRGPAPSGLSGPATAPPAASAQASTTAVNGPATPPGGLALRIPPSRALTYALAGSSRGLGWSGSALLHWTHEGGRYEAVLRQALPTGPREQRSEGTLGAEGLAPDRFGERGASGRGEQAAHFDRAGSASRIRFSGNQPDAALLPGAQDRLSVLLQLAALAAGRQRAPAVGETWDLPVATAREAGVWRFRFEGEEELPLPGGALRAWRWRRAPAAAHDLEVQVWLAPALDYLPVQLRLTQGSGDWLEQRWLPADAN